MALAIREKALGPDHLLVASSLNNMGIVFKDQGEYDKALEWRQTATTSAQSGWPKKH
jgi:hypothetical protein